MNTLIAPELPPARDSHASQTESMGASATSYPSYDPFLEQVERILNSNELSGSEVLRRLLRFLADKTVAGEADELKEYTVAIDGLGKPPSYDPRHTSAVRIQAGRLRQKLIDYYRGEGIDDSVIIGLPKGHFRLTSKILGVLPAPATDAADSLLAVSSPAGPQEPRTHEKTQPWKRPLVWVVLLSVGLNLYLGIDHWLSTRSANVPAATDLSQDLKDLWTPFIVSKRPLNLVLEDPLFVEFKTGLGIYIRDKNVNSSSAIESSETITRLRGIFKNVPIQPSKYYTAFGEANAAFLIGRLFGTRNQNFFSLVKASEVSSRELASNNILSVGIPTTLFANQLREMPISTQFLFVAEGIQNLSPRTGEPAVYADKFVTAPDEEGYAYALVSHFPGPLRNTDVESFVSNRAAGYVAAVQAFIDPDFAREVVGKLKAESGGKMPRYFQVLLKVTFKDSIPTETTCVSVRELH